MGCQQYSAPTDHCVRGTIQQIVKAQRKAAERDTVTCSTSCERSINDLLSPKKESRRRHTTIPFMLICKSSCKYFIGSGVVKRRVNDERLFECLESPVFKARGFVKGSTNCVKLELLLPIYTNGENGEASSRQNSGDCSPCNFFSAENNGGVCDFQETGVCLTVDLNGFTGITCLDPMTPQKAY